MGVHEARGTLAKGLKGLLFKWAEARSNWDDKVAREFEEKYIRALEQDLRTATSAMDHVSQVITQAKRDCS